MNRFVPAGRLLLHTAQETGAPTISFGLLWLLVGLLPATQAIPIDRFLAEVRLVTLFALGAGLCMVVANRRIRRPVAAHGALAACVLWAAVTARLDAAACLQALGVAWLIWEHCRTEQRIQSLMQAYVWGAALASLGPLFRHFAAGVPASAETLLTLSLALPPACYLSIRAAAHRAWIYWLTMTLVLAAVLLAAPYAAMRAALFPVRLCSGTTGAVGLALFALLLLLVAHGIRRLGPNERRLWGATLAVACLGATSVAWAVRSPLCLLCALALTHPNVWRVAHRRTGGFRRTQIRPPRSGFQVVMP